MTWCRERSALATVKRIVAGILAYFFGCPLGYPSLLGSSLYLDLGLRGRDPERTILAIGHEEATATYPTIDRRCQW